MLRLKLVVTYILLFSCLSYSQVMTIPVVNNSIIPVSVSTANPLLLNGHTYAITFNYVNDTTVSWNLNDISANKTLYSNLVSTGLTMSVDSMSITVNADRGAGVKKCTTVSGATRFTSTNANLYLEGFGGSIGYADPYSYFYGGTKAVAPGNLKNVLLKLAKVTDTADYNPTFDVDDANMSYAYRYLRLAQNTAAQTQFAPYILHTSASYAFQGFQKSVPLSAWDVNDPANPRRLAVGHLENNVANGLVDGKYWPSGNYQSVDNNATLGPREWLFIFDADYSEFAWTAYEVPATSSATIPIMYMVAVQRKGYVPFSPDGSGTDQFLIQANYKNIQKDTVFFTAQASGYMLPSSAAKKLNVNNVSTWVYNDGRMDYNSYSATAGLFYPRGKATSAVFQSGLVWGAVVAGDDQPRVGGSTYSTGFQPGKILADGTADNPLNSYNKVYRVRSDYATADLNEEFSDEWRTKTDILSDYTDDWSNWPASDGAPYQSLTPGTYKPESDVPGFPGASQTTWYVANDLDATKTSNLYGAQPLGIEMQATFWNYKKSGALGNTIFKKYLLINKGKNQINNMFISMWTDPDLGYASDDYVGTDTTRNMVYCYNGNYVDAQYGNQPPAVGVVFLQTPVVPSPGDSAFYMGKYVKDKKNNPITGSYYYTNGDASVGDPTQSNITGSTQFYNFMQGKIGASGVAYTDPVTNLPTRFVMAGDPINKTGWIDGMSYAASDRRMGIASGPFNMAPGDSQEVVFAQIFADAGTDLGNLAAIPKLRQYCDSVRISFPSSLNIITGVDDKESLTERKFELSQNFPNPFNPATIIKYQIPKDNHVSLKVYDMLGREVMILVNEYKRAGKYTAYFNASNLSSGVYVYELRSASSSQVRKMLLLK
jgi:hypothetical protein